MPEERAPNIQLQKDVADLVDEFRIGDQKSRLQEETVNALLESLKLVLKKYNLTLTGHRLGRAVFEFRLVAPNGERVKVWSNADKERTLVQAIGDLSANSLDALIT